MESPDQEVVLDSRTGQGYVSVIRKRPNRPGVIGPIRSSPDVANIVRTLGGEPAAGSSGQVQSLGIPYSQVISSLGADVGQTGGGRPVLGGTAAENRTGGQEMTVQRPIKGGGSS